MGTELFVYTILNSSFADGTNMQAIAWKGFDKFIANLKNMWLN